jgi:hypothetical protein
MVYINFPVVWPKKKLYVAINQKLYDQIKFQQKIYVNNDLFFFIFQNFREQSIDGSGLPLLTEEHLTNSLGLKLGPALKLKSVLAKKLGGPCPCVSCSSTLKFTASNTTTATSTTMNNLSRPTSTDSAS